MAGFQAVHYGYLQGRCSNHCALDLPSGVRAAAALPAFTGKTHPLTTPETDYFTSVVVCLKNPRLPPRKPQQT